jgi:hypothetical protein
MFPGALSLRLRAASSRKDTSNCQCRVFSPLGVVLRRRLTGSEWPSDRELLRVGLQERAPMTKRSSVTTLPQRAVRPSTSIAVLSSVPFSAGTVVSVRRSLAA